MLLNKKGEFELTVDDIKSGKNLELLLKILQRNSKKERILGEKMDYYKNLKPRV